MVDLRYVSTLLSVLMLHSQAQEVTGIVNINTSRVSMFGLSLLGATKPNAAELHP